MAGVDVPSKPINRKEQYLSRIAGQGTEIPAYPITREEAYLNEIAKSGGGGGGTTNYNALENKPQIGGVELSGNKSLADLDIASAQSVSEIKDGTTIDSFADVENALVDKTDDDAIAPEFDDTVAYNAGNLVYHDGTLYKFDSDHAAGAWDPTEVTQTSVAAEFNSLKNTITKHSFGSGGNIITLTKDVDYVCETDGYFYIYSGSNSQRTYAYGYINGYPLMTSSTPVSTSLEGYPYSSLFCRKGTVIKFAGSSDAIGRFYKLI